MSVSTISHANALGFAKVASSNITSASRKDPSAFAAMLQNAGQIEQVDAVQAHSAQNVRNTKLQSIAENSPLTANSAQSGNFAQLLAKASNTLGQQKTSQVATANLVKDSDFSISDLYNAHALNSGKNISGVQELSKVFAVQGTEAVQKPTTLNGDIVNLDHLTLDFSSLLPLGSRNFVQDLNCTDQELNSFVNLMIFGREIGPHGQNAARFFNSHSMSTEDLGASLQSLLDQAKINTTNLSAEDYNFILRDENMPVGESIAVVNGEDLEDRELSHDLEGTFQRDMALMEILARSNNQSATIF